MSVIALTISKCELFGELCSSIIDYLYLSNRYNVHETEKYDELFIYLYLLLDSKDSQFKIEILMPPPIWKTQPPVTLCRSEREMQLQNITCGEKNWKWENILSEGRVAKCQETKILLRNICKNCMSFECPHGTSKMSCRLQGGTCHAHGMSIPRLHLYNAREYCDWGWL